MILCGHRMSRVLQVIGSDRAGVVVKRRFDRVAVHASFAPPRAQFRCSFLECDAVL